MGKRSDKPRIDKDKYLTFDEKAYPPLFNHLSTIVTICEPCAGAGDMVNALREAGYKVNAAYDIAPDASNVERHDARYLRDCELAGASHIVTNPPYARDLMHELIERFITLRPTWLLLEADWMHTVQARKYMRHCIKVVSVGRLRWVKDTPRGKDNYAWYLFDINFNGQTEFFTG